MDSGVIKSEVRTFASDEPKDGTTGPDGETVLEPVAT